jgi:hypothetical protein
MQTFLELLKKIKHKFFKKQNQTNSANSFQRLHIQPGLTRRTAITSTGSSAEMPIFMPVVGIILAVLSLPFVVYAGERTFNQRIPRPAFVRSWSESVTGKRKRIEKLPVVTEGEVASDEERPKQERSHSDSEISPVGERVQTGFSVATQETYIRGMPLSKLGVD